MKPNKMFLTRGFSFKSPTSAPYLGGDNCVVDHLVVQANILIHRRNIAITIAEKRQGKG